MENLDSQKNIHLMRNYERNLLIDLFVKVVALFLNSLLADSLPPLSVSSSHPLSLLSIEIFTSELIFHLILPVWCTGEVSAVILSYGCLICLSINLSYWHIILLFGEVNKKQVKIFL